MFRPLRSVAALLRFFTTIPLGGASIEDAARGFPAIPLVGAVEGLLVSLSIPVAIYLGLDLGAVTAVALHVIVTGGLHLDGFADYIDGYASGKRSEEMLKVMKDPRKGSFAITGIVLNMLLSYVSMKAILALGYGAIPYIVLIYIASAQSMYMLASIGKEPPYRGLGMVFMKTARERRAVVLNIGIFIVLFAACLLITALWISIMLLALCLLIPLLVEKDARRRLGFVNGDVLGYCYELTKICASLLSASMLKVVLL